MKKPTAPKSAATAATFPSTHPDVYSVAGSRPPTALGRLVDGAKRVLLASHAGAVAEARAAEARMLADNKALESYYQLNTSLEAARSGLVNFEISIKSCYRTPEQAASDVVRMACNRGGTLGPIIHVVDLQSLVLCKVARDEKDNLIAAFQRDIVESAERGLALFTEKNKALLERHGLMP